MGFPVGYPVGFLVAVSVVFLLGYRLGFPVGFLVGSQVVFLVAFTMVYSFNLFSFKCQKSLSSKSLNFQIAKSFVSIIIILLTFCSNWYNLKDGQSVVVAFLYTRDRPSSIRCGIKAHLHLLRFKNMSQIHIRPSVYDKIK